MIPYALYPSTNQTNRYMIYIPSTHGYRKIYFGSSKYENYTIHKDARRKELYRERHRNDNINDPYSPGFWSWYVLWNKPSLKESYLEAIGIAKKLLAN